MDGRQIADGTIRDRAGAVRSAGAPPLTPDGPARKRPRVGAPTAGRAEGRPGGLISPPWTPDTARAFPPSCKLRHSSPAATPMSDRPTLYILDAYSLIYQVFH